MYRCPAIDVQTFCSYTNQVPCTQTRTPGSPQVVFAFESQMDIIADDAFLAEVNRKAGNFRQSLESLVASHPTVFEAVRGTGLILGLKCAALNTDVVKVKRR